MKPKSIKELYEMLDRAEMAEEVTLPIDQFRQLVELAIKGHGPQPVASTATVQKSSHGSIESVSAEPNVNRVAPDSTTMGEE